MLRSSFVTNVNALDGRVIRSSATAFEQKWIRVWVIREKQGFTCSNGFTRGCKWRFSRIFFTVFFNREKNYFISKIFSSNLVAFSFHRSICRYGSSFIIFFLIPNCIEEIKFYTVYKVSFTSIERENKINLKNWN